MSILGRNAIRGARVQFWRPVEESEHGDVVLDYPEGPLVDDRLELLPAVDEIARRIFGTERTVALTAMAPTSWGIALRDRCGVLTGAYAMQRFAVVGARPLGAVTELALAVSTDWSPNPPDADV